MIEKSSKMESMPIKKLVMSMALPAMLSMTIQAMYNIVDSIYVSRISEEALTAVSLALRVFLSAWTTSCWIFLSFDYLLSSMILVLL
ncbi:MAG: hypothetical protein KMY55_03455, partial [Dethiosulfatibacter sp.]|nr:hypothetical protein [Dethiosulfatibacter sp.]